MTQTEIKQQAWEILLESQKCTSCETEHKIENLIATSSKEDAIAFGEWLMRNGYLSMDEYWIRANTKFRHTTSELYDIYDADQMRASYVEAKVLFETEKPTDHAKNDR